VTASGQDATVVGEAGRATGVWGKRAVTLLDQVLSSLSNLLAVVLVARSVSAEAFGTFALGYAVMTVVLSLTRAYFGTRVSLTHDPAVARARARSVSGAVALLAPLVVVVVYLVSRATSGSGDSAQVVLLVVALATPIVCLQDVLRFAASASGRPWAAVWSDGLWVVIMAIPFALRLTLPASVIMPIWLGAAVVAMVVAMLGLRLLPDLRGGWVELRTRHKVGEATTTAVVIGSLGALWILFVASAAISPVASGSLRGASTAMGPVNVLLAYVAIAMTPALLRRPRSRDLRFTALVSAALVAVMSVWGTVLLVLPEHLGEAFFGESWDGIRDVLPVTCLEYVLLVTTAGALLGLKVRHRARDIVRQKVAMGFVVFAGAIPVAFLTRSPVAIAGVGAVAAAVGAIVGWMFLVRSRPESVAGGVA
jgi:O-antigen/teichoic acid export membrane protein